MTCVADNIAEGRSAGAPWLLELAKRRSVNRANCPIYFLDAVVDFGCGGGFFLETLDCREKIGVEINPAARSVNLGNLFRHLGSRSCPAST